MAVSWEACVRGLAVVVVVVGAMAVTWAIVALVRRQRYITSLRERGWTFVNSPTFDAVARLGNPPFGIGFRREPDDQITGTTGLGRPFQVIEYRTEHWSGWVGMVTLSRRLPELWITMGSSRPLYGVLAHAVGQWNTCGSFCSVSVAAAPWSGATGRARSAGPRRA